MNNPFEVLGLKGLATPDEIRSAYRALARQCHPDMIRDPAEKEAAQMRMVALNLAYEEALRLASPRGTIPVTPTLSSAEAVLMAMEQFDSAHQSFREAVRRDPGNNVYRAGALAAAVALQKEQKLPGKVRRVFKNLVGK